MLADERRLIAPGKAVDDTRGFRFRSDERPGQGIGLDR
jgi:hypothetical protein